MRSLAFFLTAICATHFASASVPEELDAVEDVADEKWHVVETQVDESDFVFDEIDETFSVRVDAKPRMAHEYPGDILDVVKGDWNSDGDEDFAVLVVSKTGLGGSTANLEIYERYPEGRVEHVLTVENFFLAWGHSHLTKTSETSFQVGYGNINGRFNWRNEMTIAYRNGTYVVAGYTSDTADGMEPENSLFCDFNLLTGDYEVIKGDRTTLRQGESGRNAPASFPLGDLSDDWGRYIPPQCEMLVQ